MILFRRPGGGLASRGLAAVLAVGLSGCASDPPPPAAPPAPFTGQTSSGGTPARDRQEFATGRTGSAGRGATFGRGATSESRPVMRDSQAFSRIFSSPENRAIFMSRFGELPREKQMELRAAAFAIGAGGEIQAFLARHGVDLARAGLTNSERFGIAAMAVLSGLHGYQPSDPTIEAQRLVLANEIFWETMGYGRGY